MEVAMNMIEKVARALEPDAWEPTDPSYEWYENAERRKAFRRKRTLSLARAAIEALREPTDIMVTRGIVSYAVHGSAAKGWQAMIDSALEEGDGRNEDDHNRLRKMTTEQLAQIREEAALFDDGFKLY